MPCLVFYRIKFQTPRLKRYEFVPPSVYETGDAQDARYRNVQLSTPTCPHILFLSHRQNLTISFSRPLRILRPRDGSHISGRDHSFEIPPDLFWRRQPKYDYRPWGGESAEDVKKRLLDFV